MRKRVRRGWSIASVRIRYRDKETEYMIYLQKVIYAEKTVPYNIVF